MHPCNVPAICSTVLKSVYMKLLDAIQVHVYNYTKLLLYLHVCTYACMYIYYMDAI